MNSRWPIAVAAGLLLAVALLVNHLEAARIAPFRRFFHTEIHPSTEKPKRPVLPSHPIDALIEQASHEEYRLEHNEPPSLAEAAQRYRERRGRHPPPWFDTWYEYAVDHHSLLNEELFDQIYHDLEPFWAVPALEIRQMAWSWEQVIVVNNHATYGLALSKEDGAMHEFSTSLVEAIASIELLLPDFVIALNANDEPRVIAPWETVNAAMQQSNAQKHVNPPTDDHPIYNAYTQYPDQLDQPAHNSSEYGWQDRTMYWDEARRACHPDSPGRHAAMDMDLDQPIDFAELLQADGQVPPYISNWTASKAVCDNPRFRYMHGDLISPGAKSTTRQLFPLFTASKMETIHNDILIPGAEYFYDGGYGVEDDANLDVPWYNKTAKAVWRGSATGGVYNKTTWRHFHRHRFVSMTNGSSLTAAEEALQRGADEEQTQRDSDTKGPPPAFGQNFALPNQTVYPLAALNTTATSKPGRLGEWAANLADIGFSWLFCPAQIIHDDCGFLQPYYHAVERVPLSEQFRFKFLPDIDGQAFSARFRSFVRSTSLPIKSTLYTEWHDKRLVPWAHFVPMDMGFAEWWPILEYFAGYAYAGVWGEDKPVWRAAHDDQAKRIADQGREWSHRALRRDDMTVYMYRLFLEYARVSNDYRIDMGWTQDLAG